MISQGSLVKRQTRIFTTDMTKFHLQLSFTGHYFSPQIVVSLNFLSVRIVLSCFYLLVFYREILNLNQTFAVCRKREAKTLNQSGPQPYKGNVKNNISKPAPTDKNTDGRKMTRAIRRQVNLVKAKCRAKK